MESRPRLGKRKSSGGDYLKKMENPILLPGNAHTPGAKKRLSYEVLGEAVDAISGKKKMAASNSSGYRPSSPDPGSDGSCRNAFGW